MKLRELTQALSDGSDVRWSNDCYRVKWETLPSGPAITVRHDNGFGGAMADSEIKDCYLKGTE